jgi:subtilisin family serine protease
MWNGANCLSETGATLGGCIYGYDFGDDDRDPADDTSASPGHGTNIAGILGANSNNGTGTVGIASNVEIMAVKVFGNTNQSTTSSIIRGINFAKYNGAKIINASF